jgi:chromosome segregation ATPase
MRKLERSNPNRPNPDQVKAYNQGRVQAENDRLNQQHGQLWQQIEEKNVDVEKLQQEVEQTSALVRQEQQEKKGILQKLKDAIASRNSMSGRLGNMTAQRNKATEQLRVTMDRLVEANQQVGTIQQEYDQDMEEMAKAYQEMSPEQRSSLPSKLRHLLDQVAKDYKEVSP